MQAAHALPHSHIDDTRPRPVVAGTDIKVAQIAWEYEHHGMSPEGTNAALTKDYAG